MNYSKPAITIQDQIAKLKARGLRFDDEALAESYLSNISYYRLRAYTYPFQDNSHPDHPFTTDISFEEIIKLYVFDRKLRILVFDALEKIEISFRTQLIYHYSLAYGSQWPIDRLLYKDDRRFRRILDKLRKEIGRCNETFLDHYNKKYTSPLDPPAWMSIEVASFGLLSIMFSNLKVSSEKNIITNYYGVKRIGLIENWLHSFSNIRNICCHHGRLWNRRLTTRISLPKKTNNLFVENKHILDYKIYAALCSMEYILRIISPSSTIKYRLIDLIDSQPFSQEKEMGFPTDWREEEFWKDDRQTTVKATKTEKG